MSDLNVIEENKELFISFGKFTKSYSSSKDVEKSLEEFIKKFGEIENLNNFICPIKNETTELTERIFDKISNFKLFEEVCNFKVTNDCEQFLTFEFTTKILQIDNFEIGVLVGDILRSEEKILSSRVVKPIYQLIKGGEKYLFKFKFFKRLDVSNYDRNSKIGTCINFLNKFGNKYEFLNALSNMASDVNKLAKIAKFDYRVKLSKTELYELKYKFIKFAKTNDFVRSINLDNNGFEDLAEITFKNLKVLHLQMHTFRKIFGRNSIESKNIPFRYCKKVYTFEEIEYAKYLDSVSKILSSLDDENFLHLIKEKFN